VNFILETLSWVMFAERSGWFAWPIRWRGIREDRCLKNSAVRPNWRPWIIEEYHKGQKTGCGIENPQFTSSDSLHPMIAVLSIVALSLLNLRELSRRDDAKLRPATELFSEEYMLVLSTWRHRAPKPNWTIHDFCFALARLGGHQNRKHDNHPGWLVLWKGWTQLQAMINGARTQKLIDRCAKT
jgi:hypothetical protein